MRRAHAGSESHARDRQLHGAYWWQRWGGRTRTSGEGGSKGQRRERPAHLVGRKARTIEQEDGSRHGPLERSSHGESQLTDTVRAAAAQTRGRAAARALSARAARSSAFARAARRHPPRKRRARALRALASWKLCTTRSGPAPPRRPIRRSTRAPRCQFSRRDRQVGVTGDGGASPRPDVAGRPFSAPPPPPPPPPPG